MLDQLRESQADLLQAVQSGQPGFLKVNHLDEIRSVLVPNCCCTASAVNAYMLLLALSQFLRLLLLLPRRLLLLLLQVQHQKGLMPISAGE
jgi:hypothetical protein